MNRRSTLDAVTLIRRYIELVEERPSNSLHLVFIDWEKAFDRIHPDSVGAVLRRYQVPDHFVEVIEALLVAPRFKVDMDGQSSGWREQESGIRQGCTLSPFLFVLVLSALMADVSSLLKSCRPLLGAPPITTQDVEFADDTALIGRTPSG
eukprot:14343067-Alexandrium_andersonii.AAC.1